MDFLYGTMFDIENLFDELTIDQDNYVAHLTTYIEVNTDFSVDTKFGSDNTGFLYINDTLINEVSSNYDSPQPYTYDFTPGVYKIDMIYNEGTVGDRVQLGFSLLRDEIVGGGEDEINHPGNPGSVRHWNNIIPEYYTIEDREGVILNQTSFMGNELFTLDFLQNPNIYFIPQTEDIYDNSLEMVNEYDGIRMLKLSRPVDSPEELSYGSWLDLESPPFIGGYSFDIGKTYIISCKAFYGDASTSSLLRFYGGENFGIQSHILSKYNDYNYVPYQFEYTYDPNGTKNLDFVGLTAGGSIYAWDFTIKEKTNLTTDELIIDGDSNQVWKNGWYYPVLPKVDKFGNFTQTLQGEDRIPFGYNGRLWNEKDVTSPVSNIDYKDSSLLIDTDLNSSQGGVSQDNSGNENIGLGVGDYRIQFGDGRLPERDSVILETKNTSDKKAF